MDPTVRLEGSAAGNDVLPGVLPATVNLRAPFAPTSDQPWLTITGVTNGVVSFAFVTNTNRASRTANITTLGQAIPITQAAAVVPPVLVNIALLTNGSFQFAFSNESAGATFTVLSSTNLSMPLSDWTVLGTPTNDGFGQYLFTDRSATNRDQRFYRVISP